MTYMNKPNINKNADEISRGLQLLRKTMTGDISQAQKELYTAMMAQLAKLHRVMKSRNKEHEEVSQ